MQLDAIVANLEQHLVWVRAQAKDKKAWPAVQQHYGLAVTPIAFGGVTGPHIKAVVQQLVKQAAAQLDGVSGEDPERTSRLWDHLAGLAEREATAHTAAATAGAGLGQIFQNATAHVDFWQEKMGDWRKPVTLICKNCGASQQKTRDFKCTFCGGDLFRRTGDDQ